MEDQDCSVSLSTLICEEDISQVDDADDDDEREEKERRHETPNSVLTETQGEYIAMLVSRESSFESRSCDESSELKCARSDSVQWILKMKNCFGFGSQTAYLAVTYFDRFLARRTIHEGKVWAMRLLSMACLSVAAKMEEIRAPALSEFQIEDYYFDCSTIQRMELLVLNTLEWRMNSVTPFAYLDYFASKLISDVGVEDLVSRAIGFIFVIVKVMNQVGYRPSTIAAAAILAASGQVLTQKLIESKISAISLSESLEAGHVFGCYNVMMQESQKEKLKASNVLVSSNLLTSCPNFNSDTISYTDSSFKRRRLL